MKVLVVLMAVSGMASAGESLDVKLWDSLLHKYVDGKGRVDYARLKATPADAASLDTLYAQVGTQKLADSTKEALLIDSYNICVWKNVLSRLPGLKDLIDQSAKVSFFYSTEFVVSGKKVNLKNLEDSWLRAAFHDPRLHMALNCASGGCPQLPREAFTPEKLDAQLDREAKKFCNEERNVRYDAAKKTVYLSHIFDWYRPDFDGKPLDFINARRPADKQIPADAKVEFVDYDWHLNDLSLPR